MKRRKRKRSSKAANPPTPKIPFDGEKTAGPSTALAEANRQTHPGDEFIAPVDAERPGSDPTALAVADYVIDLGDEFIASVEEEKPASDSVTLTEADDRTHPGEEFIASVEEEKVAGPSAAPAGADRRTHPRYEFTATAEVVAAESGARMETRVRDLSQQGCYVDTGMGLVFTAIEPEQLRTLETWLVESRETSWLAANRRRSQRVLMTIPVRVSGKTGAGSPFEEETQTLAISAHGALILVSTQVYRGQRLTLSNVQTKGALECVVAHTDRHQSDHPQVGVEFMLPNPIFWHVAFPPKDWTPRHPHAKSQAKTGESS